MTKRLPNKLIASRLEFVDPLNVGSSIGYRFRRHGKHLYGEIVLTDCSRSISWDIDRGGALSKLNKAITMLTDAREQWRRAARRKV